MGKDGLPGEQGPQGKQGEVGPKGQKGNKGQNGISPSQEYLLNQAQQIVQQELQNIANDEVFDISDENNDQVLQMIYYRSGKNCKAQRKSYMQECKADTNEICKDDVSCCPSQLCYRAIDELFCCIKNLEASQSYIMKYDLEIGSTWIKVLQEINKRQWEANKKKNKNDKLMPLIFDRFQSRVNSCKNQGFKIDVKCYDSNLYKKSLD